MLQTRLQRSLRLGYPAREKEALPPYFWMTRAACAICFISFFVSWTLFSAMYSCCLCF
jgi:hypothetical protein